jgi:hypothetical protein
VDEYYKSTFTCILAMLIVIAVSLLSNTVFPNEKLIDTVVLCCVGIFDFAVFIIQTAINDKRQSIKQNRRC